MNKNKVREQQTIFPVAEYTLCAGCVAKEIEDVSTSWTYCYIEFAKMLSIHRTERKKNSASTDIMYVKVSVPRAKRMNIRQKCSIISAYMHTAKWKRMRKSKKKCSLCDALLYVCTQQMTVKLNKLEKYT